MLKQTFFLILIVLAGIKPEAQTAFPEPDQLYRKFTTAQDDKEKIKALLELSRHYLFKGNRLQTDLDSAALFLKQAQSLAKRNADTSFVYAAQALEGNYIVIQGFWTRGSSLSKTAIDYFHFTGDYLQEAQSWIELGESIADTNSFFAGKKLQSFENARQLYKHLRLPVKTAETLQYIATCNARQGKFDTAEKIMWQAINIYKPLDNQKMLAAYNTLAEICEYQSDQHKQLKYRLELIEQMEKTGDTSNAAYYYAKLALIYAHTSMYNESLVNILRALDILKKTRQYDDFYGDLSLAIYVYIQMGKPKEALAYLLKSTQEVPPQDLAHNVDLRDMLGKCYAALGQYAKAEKYYLQMMELFSVTQNSNLYSTQEQKITDFIHYHQVIGSFYITRGLYKKAGYYYGKILELPQASIRPINLSKVYLMQFKVDSASRNYILAIKHYQQYKQIEDSLFNLSKNQQIHELNIKYETEKKSKDLQLKQQSIIALTSQTQLQEAGIKKVSMTRNIIAVSSVLLLTLVYFGYRIKQVHNRKLQVQQLEINAQNIQLRKLLAEQEKLNSEKEWLLMEVHHRVKNNLHTIISLLEAQATYLTDDALAAIQNSQHRVFAMSLIHQKLYQFENATHINMAVYLQDLLRYLQDSFGVQSRILFKNHFDETELDITQAIPIGLIINEAITNAIKYAFPGGSAGIIETSMIQARDGRIKLFVWDNGIGMPANWEKKMNSSLGLKLMRGLSEDIRASFSIDVTYGTKVMITFEKIKFIEPQQQKQPGKLTLTT